MHYIFNLKIIFKDYSKHIDFINIFLIFLITPLLLQDQNLAIILYFNH
ncbi:hypothetical protein SAMN05216524_111125 [Mucilaginibacter sp. OK098]|nr:hypothetical protein SAMN05216524_111125 [Mucilaginibacter sp. OK098]